MESEEIGTDFEEIDSDSDFDEIEETIQNRSFGMFVARWIWPVFLFYCGFSSANFFSIIYVLGFIASVVWSPNNLMPLRSNWKYNLFLIYK